MMDQELGRACFEAGLPTGKDGQPREGHTTWEQLGPETQARYERMAQAVVGKLTSSLIM